MKQRSKPRTKKAQLIRALRRKTGADLPTISEELGRLPHTTRAAVSARAAVSGLRKSGFERIVEISGKGQPSRYRIVVHPVDVA